MRIVSLLPSGTEIVCALGLGEALVGRSHECDFPYRVQSLPACTQSHIPSQADSLAIHENVTQRLERGLSLYAVQKEVLQSLQPDVIITQAQCDVCAVRLSDVEDAVASWLGKRPQIVSLAPTRLAEVWQDIQRVGDTLGVSQQACLVLEEIQTRIHHVQQAVQSAEHRPRVGCIEWLNPLMASGNWVPELVELAGGQNCFGIAGQHSPWLSPQDLMAEDPEHLILMPCGFSIPQTLAEWADLQNTPPWKNLSSVQNGRLTVVDGNQYFNRPGPRLVESLEILAEALHPKLLPAYHQGAGWQSLST
jgi:iron complex transport system substrate-binding protein